MANTRSRLGEQFKFAVGKIDSVRVPNVISDPVKALHEFQRRPAVFLAHIGLFILRFRQVSMEPYPQLSRERRCFLEINAQPERLDLTDIHCRMAREGGVLLAVNTDAHSMLDLDNARFGIGQARRGWLEKTDVLNTRSYPELRKLLKPTMES